jgi:hypothetical protein
MEQYSEPFLLREVLAYDSYVGGDLTVFERILIHQHIAQGYKFKAILLNKIDRIAKIIENERWEVPEVRYKEHSSTATIVLEIYDTEREIWRTFKKPNK